MLMCCQPVKHVQHQLYLFVDHLLGSSLLSGGVERAWTGVPRKMFAPGSKAVRCVCIEDPFAADEDPNIQNYDSCPRDANSCHVEEDY